MSESPLVPSCRALGKATNERGLLQRAMASLLGLFRRPRRAVVLCSRCHRPLAAHVKKVSQPIDVCVQGPKYKLRTFADGQQLYLSDGSATECSVHTMFPARYRGD